MTQVPKATKEKSKSGTNFIKLDTAKGDIAAQENETPEKTEKRKVVISGSKEAAKTRGVVYVSHLPHGFYENQMRKYFEQVSTIINKKYWATLGLCGQHLVRTP